MRSRWASAVTPTAHFAIGAGGCVAIGEDCYLNDCILLAQDEIRIGNHVMIDNDRGPCSIEKRRAYIRAILQNSGRAMDIQTQAKPIVAQIGNDSIDGARSVVTESIPDLAVAAGNPARLIRRFADPD